LLLIFPAVRSLVRFYFTFYFSNELRFRNKFTDWIKNKKD